MKLSGAFLLAVTWVLGCGVQDTSNPCDPNPCRTEHKTLCTIKGDEAVCKCDTGYVEDGAACVLPCSKDTTCASQHRVCINGATGATCGACLEGYHQEGNACVADQSCATSNPCGSHGTCNDAGGKITCTCETGYAGSTCADCAGGYHREGNECVLDQQCLPNTCSGHDTCDDSSGSDGALACTCNSGYEGAFCESCEPGFSRQSSFF